MRRSKIWSISKESLNKLCLACGSYKELAVLLGYRPNSGSIITMLKQRLLQDTIDVSHFRKLGSHPCASKIPMDKVLVKNSMYNRYHLKKRLVKEGLLPYKCMNPKCHNMGEWLGAPLTLQLEHLNGDPTDNRLDNLAFLCPNCHSQTITFSGRNKKRT